MSLSPDAQNFNWLVSGFVDRVPGVSHAVVVSSDGLLLAASRHLPNRAAEQLAAISASLSSITGSAAAMFGGQRVRHTAVAMQRGHFVVMSIRDGSVLAALAALEADIGMVGYEMARLAKQAGELLTPALRHELHGVLTG